MRKYTISSTDPDVAVHAISDLSLMQLLEQADFEDDEIEKIACLKEGESVTFTYDRAYPTTVLRHFEGHQP